MLAFLKKIFPQATDFAALVARGAVIVDVRTASEFTSGHIKGSKNLPLDQIKNELAQLRQLNTPVITVCRSGNRSGIARSILSNAGIDVYNGGSWNSLAQKLNNK